MELPSAPLISDDSLKARPNQATAAVSSIPLPLLHSAKFSPLSGGILPVILSVQGELMLYSLLSRSMVTE